MEAVALRIPEAPSTLPPGPRTPRFWQRLSYALRPYTTIGTRWGDRYTVSGFNRGEPLVVFTDPAGIRDIFMDEGDRLRSGEATAPILGPIIGWHSILLLDGQRHFRERRLMGPPLHGERMHVYGRLMREITARVVDGFPIGTPFPIHREMQTITMDVMLRAVFGVDQEAVFTAMKEKVERFVGQANGPSAPFIAMSAFQIDLGRFSPWGRFVRNRAVIREALLADIRQRRADGTAGRTDILSMLVDARDEQGQPMSEDELVDEMFTLLMAGHETTATALAWAFWHLTQHPDVVARVREEIARVTAGGPLEPQHVGQLEYLDAVIRETMRLTPVVTMVVRRVHTPTRIGGIEMPAGSEAGANIYLAHRRPDVWPDPERFDPDRFLGNRPSPNTFFPFGGGVRRCIGAAFAMYEMKMVLSEILPRFDFRQAPGYRMRPRLRAITIAPSRGMPVIAERLTS